MKGSGSTVLRYATSISLRDKRKGNEKRNAYETEVGINSRPRRISRSRSGQEIQKGKEANEETEIKKDTHFKNAIEEERAKKEKEKGKEKEVNPVIAAKLITH